MWYNLLRVVTPCRVIIHNITLFSDLKPNLGVIFLGEAVPIFLQQFITLIVLEFMHLLPEKGL